MQKTTKPLRSKKTHYDLETNPNLSKWFAKVAPENRLRKMGDLRVYLEKRYQTPIANQIAMIFAPRFHNNFQLPVQKEDYFKVMENFVN